MTDADLDLLAINTIRTLSIDAVQAANSGHPGTPMALAPLIYTLWNRVLDFDPQDPLWPNRDRFVLSNGHASMLLWSVLFLTRTQAVNAAYERVGHPSVSLDDIRRFRQLGSRAPGHPEYHWVSGVETTTGPLGQGIATSVGMAIARRCLADLCWVYDNNHITIEGSTALTFTEDVSARFTAYGWNVLRVFDANDLDAIGAAFAVFAAYSAELPELATELRQMQERQLPDGWDQDLPTFSADAKGVAGRDASGQVLNALARRIPWLLGGSADLAPSNKTALKFDGAGHFQAATPGGRNLHFGIREHAMAAIVNGLSLSKLRAFGSTFFVFSDYARPAIRLSALMELPTIFVFTRDAMGDGEDGPTHQPVEHLVSLRAIPGLVTIRPGDANEVVEAYRTIMQLRHKPAVLVLSRQVLPVLDRSRYASAAGLRPRRSPPGPIPS